MIIKLIKRNAQVWECLFIFFTCFIIYLANNRTLGSGDTVPNTLLAFNLLKNHTLHLDIFRESYFVNLGTYYSFVESDKGHLTSCYPIGTAIVTFPLYCIFYLYLKLANISINLSSDSFENYRLLFEKLAATIITSISVVIFYLASRIKFVRSLAFISTFIYAFATNTWTTSSQGLWQHGISNLALICIIFCLLKTNRKEGKQKKILLLAAGICCGLLPGIRPTSLLFSIAAAVYSVFTYRAQSILFLIGLFSAVPSTIWNLYYFENLTGCYTKAFAISPYVFTFSKFVGTFIGILVSPGRGLLVFSPIILYSCLGAYRVFKFRYGKDEKLIVCMTIASLLLIVNYCFFRIWWAGWSYGPRFMTDIMPIACYLINYSPIRLLSSSQKRRNIFNKGFLIFLILLTFSLFTQVIGAFGNAGSLWDSTPLSVDEYQFRLWELRDSPIERHTKALFHRIIKLPIYNSNYVQNLNGQVNEIRDANNQPFTSPLLFAPEAKVLLKAELQNTGRSTWTGYDSAVEKGEVRVRVRFYNRDRDTKQVNDNRLYIYGKTKQNEAAEAFGTINFPRKGGMYKLVLDLVCEEVTVFPRIKQNLVYNVEVKEKRFSQIIQLVKPLESSRVSETAQILVNVKNSSNFVWDNAGTNPVNFSYHWLDSEGKMVVFDGQRTVLPKSLAPQKSVELNAFIQLPDHPGKYTLILTMVQEGVNWFSNVGAQVTKIPVTVTSQ